MEQRGEKRTPIGDGNGKFRDSSKKTRADRDQGNLLREKVEREQKIVEQEKN